MNENLSPTRLEIETLLLSERQKPAFKGKTSTAAKQEQLRSALKTNLMGKGFKTADIDLLLSDISSYQNAEKETVSVQREV